MAVRSFAVILAKRQVCKAEFLGLRLDNSLCVPGGQFTFEDSIRERCEPKLLLTFFEWPRNLGRFGASTLATVLSR